MAEHLYAGETLKLEIQIKDADGVLFTPDELEIACVSPSGDQTTHALTDNPETIFANGTGIYLTYFDTIEAGTYAIEIRAVYEENSAEIANIETASFLAYERLSSI